LFLLSIDNSLRENEAPAEPFLGAKFTSPLLVNVHSRPLVSKRGEGEARLHLVCAVNGNSELPVLSKFNQRSVVLSILQRWIASTALAIVIVKKV
jgi:hypothetical protein